MFQYKRIAVKIGSNVLTRKDGTLDITRMSALVDQIAELHEARNGNRSSVRWDYRLGTQRTETTSKIGCGFGPTIIFGRRSG